ncbi:MAG TPA: PhnD/SsuA/transferrin family substrate-binding protein [Allocoleopsis sp.]
MGKLVFLKVERDGFNQGFKVTLDIAEEGRLPHIIGVSGSLRPDLDVAASYKDWQEKYYRLESSYRRTRLYFIQEDSFDEEDSEPERPLQDCYEAAEKLRESFRCWIKSEEFRSIEEELLADLSKSEQIRVILQTEDELLRKLPWEAWNFFQRFPNAELGIGPLSSPGNSILSSRVQKQVGSSSKVKILAILGNSDGIDIQEDKKILENLPYADVCFLIEPSREQFKRLWEDSWDILFFAGHSSSKDGDKGYIYINRTGEGQLEISELEETLKTAIANGLKLAIFNSCDGLGLARQLEKLHIPQVIVMREPVPDKIAQEFLKYFLTSFSRGTPLYTSVRHARTILRELLEVDRKFPGASWLPAICQNPTAKDFVWPSPQPKLSWWHKAVGEPLKQHSQTAIISGLAGGAIALIAVVWLSSSLNSVCSPATEKSEGGACFKDLRKTSLTIGFLSSPHQQRETNYDYQYILLQKYLEQQLGDRVKEIFIKTDYNLSYQEMQNQIARQEFDIVFAHSPMNSWVAKKKGYLWLGTQNPSAAIYYRSVLFVRADSPIQSIADLKPTTKIALGHIGSASSFYVPVYDLYGKSLTVILADSHGEIQKLVKMGKADVGASIDSAIANQPELRIIHRSKAIPGAGVFISPNLAQSDRTQIQQILRQAPRGILEKAGYLNLAEPNYDYVGQISSKTEEIIQCANFEKNPVQFYCDR